MGIIKKVGNNKSIIESFLSLSILNGLNLLLPLITLPYMLRIIGPSKYGIYSFVYVLIQYILLLSTYGFNFSATKQIAQFRDDKDQINKIYNSVIYTRLLLAVLGICIFYLLSFIFFSSSEEILLFSLGIGMVLGDVFIPVWLFQGMEKMRYLTIVNAISKIVFTVLIFFVILSPEDYIYIILLNSLGYIVAGIFSTVIVFFQFKLYLSFPCWKEMKFQLSDGFHVFCSTLSMNLYRNSNIFILGLFASDASVGIYSAAEKVIKALQGVISPVAEALFPHLGYRFKSKKIKENILYLIKLAKPFSLLLFLMAISVFIFAPFISNILLGSSFDNAIPLIRLMTLVIIFGGLNYVLGIVGLINLNLQRNFFRSVVISGTLSVLLMFLLVHWLNIYAGAISMIMSEIVLFAGCTTTLYSVYRRS